MHSAGRWRLIDMTGQRQEETLVAKYRAAPHLIPERRFEPCGKGKVKCVLDGRTGYGITAVDLNATYPAPDRRHRILLQFFGDSLRTVEGPDTAPTTPRRVLPIYQFSRWQIGCLEPHDWECACGLRWPSYAPLWRHIGAERPAGWGRQDGIEHALVEHVPWPRDATRTLDLIGYR